MDYLNTYLKKTDDSVNPLKGLEELLKIDMDVQMVFCRQSPCEDLPTIEELN